MKDLTALRLLIAGMKQQAAGATNPQRKAHILNNVAHLEKRLAEEEAKGDQANKN